MRWFVAGTVVGALVGCEAPPADRGASVLFLEGPADYSSNADEDLFVGWGGPVYGADPTELAEDEVLELLRDATRVVAWPSGEPRPGELVVSDAGSLSLRPRLRWVPSVGAEEPGWQALIIEYDQLPDSFQVRIPQDVSPDGQLVVRFSRTSMPVVSQVVARDITPADAAGAAGGNTFPDGHLVSIGLSESLVDAAGAHEHVRMLDWDGCLPRLPSPPSTRVGSLVLECPRRADADAETRSPLRVEIDGALVAEAGGTIQDGYALGAETDTLAIEVAPTPGDRTAWHATDEALAGAFLPASDATP